MLKYCAIALVTLSLTGCTWFYSYQTPIQQGRIIHAKQIAQLKPGMSKPQVEFILGTAGVQDPFHPNTWHYVYTHKIGGYPKTEKKLTVVFKDNKLVSITGDYTPPTALKYQYTPAQTAVKNAPTPTPKTKSPKVATKPATTTPKTPAKKAPSKALWMLS